MKKSITIIILLFILFTNANAQHRVRTCSSYPNNEAVLQSIKEKPILNVVTSNFSLKCNVNDSVIKRLVYLLNPAWDSAEIEYYLIKEVKKQDSWFKISETAKKISKGDDSIFKIKYDSIINYWKADFKEDMQKEHIFDFNKNILRVVAFLEIKQAIPIIKKYFNNYNNFEAELALARLGNKIFQKKIIANSNPPKDNIDGESWLDNMSISVGNLMFIGTQESIYPIANWLDTSKYYTVNSVGSSGMAAYKVLGILSDFILNKDFQEKIKNIDFSGQCPCTTDIILDVKKWLQKNKGKYIINRNFYPY